MMRTILAVLFAIFACFSENAHSANDADPNAAIRKSIHPSARGASDVLADIQKLQKRNNELSVEHFTKQIQADPKDAASYARRAKAYSGLKDYDKAYEDAEKAIALDPKLAEAYQTRAVIHFVRGNYPASWEDVRQVEANGAQMWPSFMEALKQQSTQGRENGGSG
jgi:tetratricopeptide (TPR) repeat protein